MKQISFFIGIFFIASCNFETKKLASSQEVEVVNYDGLHTLINKKDNKTYVVNFWATWCKPCVEELPHFEKLRENYINEDLEVILISLDFPSHVESRVKPFIKENNIQSKVVLMADPDQNTWIPKVDSIWSGAIPATLIYNTDKRVFFEQPFTYQELEKETLKLLKPN